MDAFANRGRSVRIAGDACVYGLGAYLLIDGAPVEFYAVPLTPDDEHALRIKIGDPKAQQAAEAFNLLVALRLWKPVWAAERVRLEVRADNIAALTLILHLKGSGHALNRIAREVALDLGDASFRPDVCSHTPGVASGIADALSRRFEPGVVFVLPPMLRAAREAHPPSRSPHWWRS